MVRHRSTIPSEAERSAPQPASDATLARADYEAQPEDSQSVYNSCESVSPASGATGVAGGLHLFIPENEAALAVADSGHVPLHRVVDRALTTLHRDQFRASALVSRLTDASRIHFRRDIGALTILFRNPEDAEWVMQALTELRSGI